ncbi:MAG TPA: hypothetical protein VF221_22780 [Chloroflexota bacterium]
MTLTEHYSKIAAALSDDDLEAELHCARRCALCSTRTRRDLALLRLRCLDCELQRRATPRVGMHVQPTAGDTVASRFASHA